MDLSHPARTVVPSLAADVLLVLAGTTLPMTGRRIHGIAGRASWSGVRRVLQRMVDSGLVDMTEAGSANLYCLNREHVAVDAVLALVDLRGRLFDRIRAAVAEWPIQPVAMAVFGSAARGDGDEDSDVDLFVVRPEAVAPDAPQWVQGVAALSQAVKRWSGNRCSVIEVSPSQLEEMIHEGAALVDELGRDQIPLVGANVLDAAASLR